MSDRIRKGTIAELDSLNGWGVISDENHQEIEFKLSEVSFPLALGQEVSFSIKLVDHKLIATGIKILLSVLTLSTGLGLVDLMVG